MVDTERQAGLRRRLEAGEWLWIGEVATVLQMGRSTVHDKIRAGLIGYRKLPGSRYRECSPEDVLKLLRERQQEHRGEE